MAHLAQESRDDERSVPLDGLRASVRVTGAGPPILLLHGFPHTKEVWRQVVPLLVDAGHQVIAPDLRGIGATDAADDGYDAITLAQDQMRLLDALSLDAVHVVGFDIGAAPAFAMAAAFPSRVRSLTVVEAVIGGLAGAEDFLRTGGPWWFAFHQTPGGLAEDVVAGSEDRYVRFFLDIGSRRGVPEDLIRRFVAAYTGVERLRPAFEHYRALAENSRWNRAWAENGALTMPVTAVGAATVRDAPARQLERVSVDLAEHVLESSGHIVPIDAPDELAWIVLATAARTV